MDYLELLGLRVIKVNLVYRGNQDHQEPRENQEDRVPQVNQAIQAFPVPKV